MNKKDFILSRDGKTLKKYIADEKNVIIPNGITSIGDFAFSRCINLESIKIPESVISIGRYTFSFCYYLKNIIIPESVTSIGDNAFLKCSNLQRLGKFKAFNISRTNRLYCLDKRYEENKWNYVTGKLELCKNGIHYVDNLYDIFNFYNGEIDKNIAIYEIETDGEDIKELFGSKHCCRSIKLKRRIYREELIKMLKGEI